MTQETLYRLKDSTAVEPLVNRWPAWSHVLSPIACSLHLKNFQVELLRAYLKDPSVHVRACQDAKLRSGRFVDIPAERAEEVRDFLQATEITQGQNLKLAERLIEFYNHLLTEAKGHSLEPFYKILPPEMQGYVELLYDYYHRPSLRFLEGLVYESPYYNKSLQSFRLFRQEHDNSRPFFMSTPRLPSASQIEWPVSFDSPRVDELFSLDTNPRPLCEIRELLGLQPTDEELLTTLLSAEPVRPRETWKGETIRVRYFGHACVLLEWNGVSILTDPCLGLIPSEGGLERYSYGDLPEKIDYALVTHNHHDHYALETLLRLRHRIGCLVVPRSFGLSYGDLSLKLLSRKIGFEQVQELDTLESIKFPGGEIISAPFLGEHADLAHGKTAYVVRAGQEQILFAADSDCLDKQMYVHLRQAIGPINTVFIGMECVGAPLSWSCGPFLPAKPEHSINQSRRYKGSDSADALEILDAVGAERLYVYAMGLEPWFEHLLGLAYTEDAKQLKEAKLLLQKAPQLEINEHRLLNGKDEFHLHPSSNRQRAAAPQQRAETGQPTAASSTASVAREDYERESSRRTRLDEQLKYWQRQLHAPLPTLALPTDYPRPASHSYQGATLRFRLSLELMQALHALSREQGSTLYMTLLAAFTALLYRYTGQADVIVGTPVANRERVETAELIGCLINTMAVRTDVSGNPDFAELVGRVREVVLSGQAHGEVEYEAVVEAVGAARRGNHNPLFQVWFATNDGAASVEESFAAGSSQAAGKGAAPPVDIALIIDESETELSGAFHYNKSLFEAATIEAMSEHYLNLLGQAVAGTTRGVLDIPLETEATDEEKAQTISVSSETSETAAQFKFD
jgi:L-ascorbate metabolism protein UlaG (beta-lactamase superfamily)